MREADRLRQEQEITKEARLLAAQFGLTIIKRVDFKSAVNMKNIICAFQAENENGQARPFAIEYDDRIGIFTSFFPSPNDQTEIMAL